MTTTAFFLIECVVSTPVHAGVPELLHYTHASALPRGQWVQVPLGKRVVLALVWESRTVCGEDAVPHQGTLKRVAAVLPLSPMPKSWLALIRFAALYYQRPIGEVALAALPSQLRTLTPEQLQRRLHKSARNCDSKHTEAHTALKLGEAQHNALTQLVHALHTPKERRKPQLLWGVTGSGKTEVYLQMIEHVLASCASAQAMVLVPEINLTPQLEARFRDRLHRLLHGHGAPHAASVVLMHSALSPAQRLANWLAILGGAARVVLGTRLAVFAPLAHLRLVIVDEEHDASYKAQDGARYSARDLCVWRAHAQDALVVLGSATPSLQSWYNCQMQRYARIDMPERIGGGLLPQVNIHDMRTEPKTAVLAPRLREAMMACASRGMQSLVFINRRGYAPVLHCTSCEWKSHCPHCSAYTVFHKRERLLRCHHCTATQSVPRACPACGHLDIGTQGRGTEQIEEVLLEQLQGLRVLRIDADTTRQKGALEAQLAQVHAGEVDVLVGTQMITKGHDFRRIGLVIALNPDLALYAQDYRAPETLFALLMQAAGRAGRAPSQGQAQFWLQTREPQHPLYRSLQRHDYGGFVTSELLARKEADMPPFTAHALLRAEARSQEAAQAFLNAAFALTQSTSGLVHLQMPSDDGRAALTLYPALPMSMARVAGVERAQMLVECSSRARLSRFLSAWAPLIKTLDRRGILRWAIDVDPLSL